jgi:predicted Fe-S protein YdhL (DUF1289 family)
MEPEVQRRLDMMAEVFEWWQRASDAERVAITRAVIELERVERRWLADPKLKPVDAQPAFADAQA